MFFTLCPDWTSCLILFSEYRSKCTELRKHLQKMAVLCMKRSKDKNSRNLSRTNFTFYQHVIIVYEMVDVKTLFSKFAGTVEIQARIWV